MSKIKQLCILCFCVSVLSLSFNCDVNAAYAETFTSEEYLSELTEFCETNALQVTISNLDSKKVYTRQMLNSDKALIMATSNKANLLDQSPILNNSNTLKNQNAILPYAMVVNKDVMAYKLVSNNVGNQQLAIKANITENAQAGTLMNINSVSSYAQGYGINFDSWTQTSWRRNSALGLLARQFSIKIQGTLACSISSPSSGGKFNCITPVSFDITMSL